MKPLVTPVLARTKEQYTLLITNSSIPGPWNLWLLLFWALIQRLGISLRISAKEKLCYYRKWKSKIKGHLFYANYTMLRVQQMLQATGRIPNSLSWSIKTFVICLPHYHLCSLFCPKFRLPLCLPALIVSSLPDPCTSSCPDLEHLHHHPHLLHIAIYCSITNQPNLAA